jgi:phosphatidylglycerophosphate synthase
MSSGLRRDLLRPANLLSLVRIALACGAAGALLAERPLAVLALGVPAGLTDYLDGWMARRRGEVTQLGALLDSLADSVFMLVLLVAAHHIGVWPFYLLLAWGLRDLGVFALRASAAQQGFTVPSSTLGKVAFNLSGWSFFLMTLDLLWPLPWLRFAALCAIHAGIALSWLAAGGYLAEYARRYRG